MENFIIRFTHRGQNYVTLPRKAKNKKTAINSVLKQCEIADRFVREIIQPVIVSVKKI